MVYDEGFDFSFGNPTSLDFSSYFAFSKYGKNNFSIPQITSTWVSYCHATLIGWYQEGDTYGCFYGYKVGSNANQVTNGEASNKQVVVEGSMTAKTFLEVDEQPRENYRFMESKFTSHIKLTSQFTDHAKVVERINKSKGTWKAAVCEEFEGKTIEQLNKMAGRKKSRNSNFHLKSSSEAETNSNDSVFEFFRSNKKKSYSKKYSQSSLPKEFNYRQYTTQAKSQVNTI
jgi:cathepsin C